MLLTQAYRPQLDMLRDHHRKYFLDLAGQMGFSTSADVVELARPDAERRSGAELIRAHGLDPDRTICVAPGAQFGGAKRYPTASYAEVLRQLTGKGWQVIVLGTTAERAVGDACLNGAGTASWNAAGETTLLQALQILSVCRLLCCNDSGLMHAAAGMGRPVVAIFGATDPARTAPSGTKVRIMYHPADCSPCLERECSVQDQPCMANVQPDEVARICLELLQ
jgi:heptosyltransferase-2